MSGATQTCQVADAPAAALDPAAFLDALRRAQSAFVDDVRGSLQALGTDPAHAGLREAAAAQIRLAQQYLDGVRLLLAKRWEFDSEARAAVRMANEDAATTVAIARAEVAWRSPSREEGHERPEPVLVLPESVVLRRDDDQVAAACRQDLVALLERWWDAEHAAGRAAIDTAHLRGSELRHRAEVEAAAVLAELDVSEGVSVLPDDVVTVLADAGHKDLRALLVELQASLVAQADAAAAVRDAVRSATSAPGAGPRRDATTPLTATQGLVIRKDLLDAPAELDGSAGAQDESFRRFWYPGGDAREPDAAGSGRGRSLATRFVTRFVLPVGAITSGFALVMAWVG